MALKDWKKIGEYEWYNKHYNYILEVLFAYPGNHITVFVDKNRTATVLKKTFKTKSQALKFAKSYMRKH